MSTISTHVLNTALGKPAQALKVTLRKVTVSQPKSDEQPTITVLATKTTDTDGRIKQFIDGTLDPGHYQLVFAIDDYFTALGEPCFYPTVCIDFILQGGDEHYHVPLLLSPYSYTTYRGS